MITKREMLCMQAHHSTNWALSITIFQIKNGLHPSSLQPRDRTRVLSYLPRFHSAWGISWMHSEIDFITSDLFHLYLPSLISIYHCDADPSASATSKCENKQVNSLYLWCSFDWFCVILSRKEYSECLVDFLSCIRDISAMKLMVNRFLLAI